MKKEPKNKKKEKEEMIPVVSENEVIISEDDIKIVEQEERPEEDYGDSKVGSVLRKARLKSGKKVTEVAKDLCIRKVYLDAIEASNYSEIPNYPYGPGFVRSYADYLGLNGARLVQLFKDETSVKDKDEGEYFVLEPQKEITAPNHKYLLISIASILALYFIWFLFNRDSSNDIEENVVVEDSIDNNGDFVVQVEDFITEEAAKTEQEALSSVESTLPGKTTEVPASAAATPVVPSTPTPAPVAPTPVAPAVSAPVVTPAPVAASVTPAEPITPAPTPVQEPIAKKIPNDRVFLDIKGDVWVEVKDLDDTLYLSKELKAGDSYVLPKRSGLIISAGKPDIIDVYVNGKLTPVITKQQRMNIHLDDFVNP